MTGGAVEEPAELAGAAVLAARALTEGTERYDAIALVEAAERLGASLHAEAGWDALSSASTSRRTGSPAALELVAEVLLRPTFPRDEVERLRDERLNDLLQARADPRRRVEEAFANTVYAPEIALPPTVGRDPRDGRGAHRRRTSGAPTSGRSTRAGRRSSSAATSVARTWSASRRACSGPGAGRLQRRRRSSIRARPLGRVVRVVHRPGSVQTEIRIGHRGLPRRIGDFHAVSVMAAILGGLFNSRLNMKLREEKGYTYGAGAGFDMRRGAGPFAARAPRSTPRPPSRRSSRS